MRTVCLSLLTLVAVSGCSKGRDAERRYAIVEHGPDYDTKCAEAKKVAAAYLDDNDVAKSSEWKRTAARVCADAAVMNRLIYS